MRLAIFYILGLFLIFYKVGESNASTLIEAYQAALKQSELMAQQFELVSQAEERLAASKAALLPSVNVLSNFLQQEAPSNSTGNAIFPASQSTARINVTQPLFRGFRDFAAIRQQKNLLANQKELQNQAHLTLFGEVHQNFFLILQLEQDLNNLFKEQKIFEKREQELLNFIKVGRSRPSERLVLQANRATLQAQIDLLKGQINSAREIFQFLTGLNSNELLQPQVEVIVLKKDVQYYYDQLEERPEIQAQLKNYESAREGVRISQGTYWPNLDLSANYYLFRPGVLANVHWDLGLNLSWTIFNGGLNRAQALQATSAQTIAFLQLQRIRRQLKQEISVAYENNKALLQQIKSLEVATQLFLANYTQLQKDYTMGLVNNLEVIQALTQAQQTQRQYDKALIGSQGELMRLEIISMQKKLPSFGSEKAENRP